MFMHALVHVFFLAFIAITLLGHVLLAEALIRSRDGANGWNEVPVDPSGTRSLNSVILEATQSC